SRAAPTHRPITSLRRNAMNILAHRWTLTLLLVAGLALAPSAWAQEWRTEALSPTDQTHMRLQRDTIDNLARRHLGEQLRGDAHDLDVIQQLLDRHLIADDDTATLQALGVVLGDQLQRDLDLKWTIYIDRRGRSRALEIPN